MAPRSGGRQPHRTTAEQAAELSDVIQQLLKKPHPRARRSPTDPDVVVKKLRAYFEGMGGKYVEHPEDEPARYRMFARWAAEAVTHPELAVVYWGSIEAEAPIDREAWHAALMIRLVTGAWRLYADPYDGPYIGDPDDDEDGGPDEDEDEDEDEDNHIEMPLPWDPYARSTEPAGSARPSSIADRLAMPTEPSGKRGRRPKHPESLPLIVAAVRYCLSHGYYATASSADTEHWGCLLVAKARVSADEWAGMCCNQRDYAEQKVRDEWFAYWTWDREEQAKRIRALQIADEEHARASGRKGG